MRPKVCIFCGGKPLSSEHIWSEWTYDVLPKLGGSHTRGYAQTAKGNPNIKGIVKQTTYQGQVNVTKVRAVCASKSKKGGTNSLGRTGCNNGWMSDLDTQVIPILTPLMLGHPALLTEDCQRTLARWIVMKLMVAEFADPTPDPNDIVTPQKERTAFFADRSISPGWRVWIARQTGKIWRTGYLVQAATLGTIDETGTPIPPDNSRAKNTKLATLGFGALVIHAFTTRVPEMMWEYPEGTLFRIYPFKDMLVWPPTNVMTGAQIDYLWRQFERFQAGLRWVP